MDGILALVILILLVMAGSVLIMPIIALVWASRANSRAEELEKSQVHIRARLAYAESRLQQFEAQRAYGAASVSEQAAQPEAGAARASEQATPAGNDPLPDGRGSMNDAAAPAPAPEPAAEYRAASVSERVAPAGNDPLPDGRGSMNDAPAPAPEPAPAPGFDFEGLVGVRLFAWLGGAALFIGAALFLHYSIQHNLIAPPVRVGIGLVAGAAAMVFGDWLRPRANWAGQAIGGAGVAILYASIFAARTLYHLIPTPAAFAAMAAVTTVAGIMAVKRSAYMLAVLGTVGGFLTPYLLSTGEDRAFALFAYVALLDLGVVAVARQKRWYSLGLFGLIGSVVIYFGWASSFLVAEKVPTALLASAVLAALFVLVRQYAKPGQSEDEPLLPRVVACLGAGAPLVVAIAVSGRLRVEPYLLVPYLMVVSAGAVYAAKRNGFWPLVPTAAALSSITLMVRASADVFPSQRTLTLALFLVVPAGFWVLWFVRRQAPEASILLGSLAAVIAGAFGVLVHIEVVEALSEPIAPLLIFMAIQVAALAAVGWIKRSGAWILGAQALMFLTLLTLAPRFSHPRLVEFAVPISVSMLVFWVLPLVHARLRSDGMAWLSSALALALHYPMLLLYGRKTWHDEPMGALAVGCAVLALVMLRHARAHTQDRPADRLTLSALFGGVTLGFVTAAVPIILSNEWLTVAWALEVTALAWLVRRVPHKGLVVASVLLAAGVCIRLVFNQYLWEYHARTGTPILNWYVYTFGVPALAFIVAARLIRNEPFAASFWYPSILRAAAGVLLFALLNVEIADFYSTGEAITFRFSGDTLVEDMTYSLSWGIFALALIVIGLVRRSKPTRIGAILVLMLTIGKVFLHDLWHLGALYRVASVIGLAMALLAMSFLIQRFILRKDPS